MGCPKIRNINAFLTKISGQDMICLQDPAGINEEMIFVSPDTFFIISLFDGQHSLLDIQSEYMRRFGQLLYTEKINEVIDDLDSRLLLDSDKFRDFKRQMYDEFIKSPVRTAIFAGKGYDKNEERLKDQINNYFTSPEGPGRVNLDKSAKDIKGVVAPHIDFSRGGTCYAFAHKEIGEASEADIFVVLGTAHVETDNFFALTLKDFETPLGILETDKFFINSLEKRCKGNLFVDELVHQREHSIEFQCIFLQYLFGGQKKIKIVPILCGSFHKMVAQNTLPDEDPQVREFLMALKETISSSDRKVCLIASADLAHLGLQFGDRHSMSSEKLQEISREDLQMLKYVENVDPNGFFLSIQKENDKRRICGLSPIYTMLSTMESTRGKLLKYDQWKDPQKQSTVTFASLVFY